MKEILQNKLLIIFLIFFVIVGFFCSAFYNTYASETITFSYEGVNYTLPDLPNSVYDHNYIFIFGDFNYTSNSILFNIYASDTNVIYGQDYSCYRTFTIYHIDSGLYDNYSNLTYAEMSDAYTYSLPCVYSNCDLLNTDGDVVFSLAPLEMVELMKAIQPEEIPQQIIQITKMILPIFLLIFGTLLVLYLLKSKNLLHL